MRTKYLCLLVALALTACGQRSESTKSQKIQWIDPSKVQAGPIRRETLTPEMEKRIAAIKNVFSDVDSMPLEKWIDDFKRDADPEREVRIWEAMARTYSIYASNTELTSEKKKELYGLLLAGSGAPPDDVLKNVQLKYLTEAQARDVLATLAKNWNGK